MIDRDALPGIGPWSARMFLLGHDHRPDILPAADYGIRRQIELSWQLPTLPSAGAPRASLDWVASGTPRRETTAQDVRCAFSRRKVVVGLVSEWVADAPDFSPYDPMT